VRGNRLPWHSRPAVSRTLRRLGARTRRYAANTDPARCPFGHTAGHLERFQQNSRVGRRHNSRRAPSDAKDAPQRIGTVTSAHDTLGTIGVGYSWAGVCSAAGIPPLAEDARSRRHPRVPFGGTHSGTLRRRVARTLIVALTQNVRPVSQDAQRVNNNWNPGIGLSRSCHLRGLGARSSRTSLNGSRRRADRRGSSR